MYPQEMPTVLETAEALELTQHAFVGVTDAGPS
jgi:hypothetical protein